MKLMRMEKQKLYVCTTLFNVRKKSHHTNICMEYPSIKHKVDVSSMQGVITREILQTNVGDLQTDVDELYFNMALR